MLRAAGDERKAQIVEEATRLFSRNGFDKVTMKELADACVVTEPAIYRHFPSKDAVYDAVLGSLQTRLHTDILFAELETENDIEVLLKKLATHIISFFTEHEDIYRLVLYSTLRGHTYAQQTFSAVRGTYVRFLHKQLDRLAEQGAIIPKNNEITARCFVGSTFDCALSASLWRGMLGRVYHTSEIIANNVPVFARGLRAPTA